MHKIKAAIFGILENTEQNGLIKIVYDVVIIALIVLNVIAVIIEPSLKDSGLLHFFRYFEIISIIIFTVEYLLRVWVADFLYKDKGIVIARLLFIISPMALIDLAAILPFYVPFLIPIDLRVLRILRVFRLFRVLKINRYTNALSMLVSVIKSKAAQLVSVLFLIVILLVISSVIMFNVENIAQPDMFHSVFDALWWSVSTLTTVGYGDIYPVTALGKIISAIIAMLGIGIVAIPTGIIASGFSEQIQNRPLDEKKYCPYCGREIESGK